MPGKLGYALIVLGWITAWSQVELKVENVAGEVLWQKNETAEWKPLKVGLKLRQSERVRTGVESNVTVLFPNGSSLVIGENSLVDFRTLVEKGGESQTAIGVRNGSVLFNVKKLAAGRSSFQFEAATATAAIRGTEGEFRVRGARVMAGLISGKLEIFMKSGASAQIQGGQIALQGANGFVIVERPQDPQQLKKIVEAYFADSTAIHTDSLKNYGQSALDTPSGLCRLAPLPSSSVSEPRLTLRGSAPPGAQITAGNSRTVAGADGAWAMDLVWSADQKGSRSYSVSAEIQGTTVDCGKAVFDYVAGASPLEIQLSTPDHLRVCGPATIAGKYQGDGARLRLRLGSMTMDLSSPTGEFSYALAISDQARNWDLQKAELELSGAEGTRVREITFEVDRRCPEVNKLPPLLTVSTDEARCLGLLHVSQVQGDEVTVSLFADGEEFDRFTVTSDVRGKRWNLLPGKHRYAVRAVDLAGNRAEKELRDIGCYPDTRFALSLSGPAREIVRIPPPPPGGDPVVTRSVDAAVLNLPGNDPGYLKRVTFKLDGRVIRNITGSQIRDVRFPLDVPLTRGAPNVLIFEVELVSGRVQTVTKTFDFR